MTRNEQLSIGRKIKRLISDRIGKSFSGKYQGAGEVATLVLAAGSKKFTSKMKHFLREDLKLELHVGSKNHGSGENYTLQVALSEITPDSKKIINEEFQKIEVKIKKRPISTEEVEEKIQDSGDSQPEEERSIPEEGSNISSRSNFIKRISPFLNGIFRFERKYRPMSIFDPFSFAKDRVEEKYLAISSLHERIATEVEMALVWFLRNRSIVVREGKDLLIKYDEADLTTRPKLHYCLPPSSDSSLSEVSERLSRVSLGSKPRVETFDEKRFLVKYAKKETAPNIYKNLKEMGWPVEERENSFLIEGIDWKVSSEKEKIDAIPVVSKESSYLTEAEREALVKLKALVADEKTFMLLSEATKKDILDILKEMDLREKREEAERYATSLLSVFKL